MRSSSRFAYGWSALRSWCRKPDTNSGVCATSNHKAEGDISDKGRHGEAGEDQAEGRRSMRLVRPWRTMRRRGSGCRRGNRAAERTRHGGQSAYVATTDIERDTKLSSGKRIAGYGREDTAAVGSTDCCSIGRFSAWDWPAWMYASRRCSSELLHFKTVCTEHDRRETARGTMNE